jgi:hypothetical protein
MMDFQEDDELNVKFSTHFVTTSTASCCRFSEDGGASQTVNVNSSRTNKSGHR